MDEATSGEPTGRGWTHPPMIDRAVAVVVAVAVVLAGLVAVPPSAAAEERDPIVFVHGYSGGKSNWTTMVGRFAAAGWDRDELVVWPYNWNQRNTTTAGQLAVEVSRVREATGADQVTLITHSMGGLSSRYFLKELDGSDQVGTWVSLGGPNNGTTWAYGCLSPSCFDMRPNSALLRGLNGGDATPGDTRYGTFWSACDAVVNPSRSTEIAGADNTRVGCVGHLSLLIDRDVFDRVLDYVS